MIPDTRSIVPDLSEWNGPVNFQRIKDMGAVAVGIRVSWLLEDVRFKEYWAGAKAVGLKRFGYHFLDWRGDVNDQLKLFTGLLAEDPGELPPKLDLEMDPTPYGYSAEESSYLSDVMPTTRLDIGSPTMPEKYANDYISSNRTLTANQVQGLAWNFLEGMQSFFHKVPGLYTGFYYFEHWIPDPDPAWSQFPLWLPWYAPESIIRIPKPWTYWDMWQYDGKGDGLVWGSTGKEIDLSKYKGTSAQLLESIGDIPAPTPAPVPVPVPIPAPIPNPAPIKKYVVSNTCWICATMNDGAGCSLLKAMYPGNPVTVVHIEDEWAQLSVPVTGYIRFTNLKEV